MRWATSGQDLHGSSTGFEQALASQTAIRDSGSLKDSDQAGSLKQTCHKKRSGAEHLLPTAGGP